MNTDQSWRKVHSKPGFSIYRRTSDGADVYGAGHCWVTTKPGPVFHRTLKRAKEYSDAALTTEKTTEL